MRGLYLLALLGFAALVAADEPWGFESYAEARIDSQEAQLHLLEEELDNLAHRIRDDHDDYEHHVDELELRLDHIEGNDCHDHEFSCGRKSGQCISDLLVCDGHYDCENHHDEEEEHVCADVVPAGRAWAGIMHWRGCTNRRHNPVTVVITGNKRMKDFGERIWVTAVIIEKWVEDHEDHHATYATTGYYNFADRHLELDSTGEKGLGMTCEDAGEGLAECRVFRVSDHSECGHALLTRSI